MNNISGTFSNGHDRYSDTFKFVNRRINVLEQALLKEKNRTVWTLI
jgi:hypothetical protein